MSPEYTRRTIQAMDETQRLIDKEMRYSPDLRKQDYLASLHRHVAKLTTMLETGVIPPLSFD
jgi:hypothetical protein